jgi:peptidoglycan hydrolase-like protein with peptidoglycan-binding domain
MVEKIPTTAERVLTICNSQLGVKEDPPNSNKQKYGVWANKNGQKWCAIVVAWVFAKAGYDLRNISRNYAYTPSFFRELCDAGWTLITQKKEGKPADVVFFNFPGDTVNNSGIQHVGIIESNHPSGSYIYSYEGNTSITSDDNGGEYQLRKRPYSYIDRIVRPPYSVGLPVKYILKRTLKVRKLKYMKGADVKKVQKLVKATVDGIYGPETAAKVGSWQRKMELKVDGVFGPKSAKAAGWLYVG